MHYDERILAAEGATLGRLIERRAAEYLPPSPTQDAVARWDAMKPRPEPPKRERGLDTAPFDTSSEISRQIGAAIVTERERTLALLVALVAEIQDAQSDDLQRATRPLTSKLSGLKSMIADLRAVLVPGNGPIDLPNPISRRVN
jgi:hypothetical protein